MRFNIFEEGDFFMIGGVRRDMDPIVVECENEPLPIIYGYDFAGNYYGRISDIRIENGNLTGEVEWLDPALDDGSLERMGMRLGGYYIDVEERKEGGKITVTKATLAGVAMVMKDEVPK